MGRKSGLTHQNRLPVDELSILNHELGNVLNGLSGMAGLLRDSGLTVEQGRWLEAIEQSGRQMYRIMESTLMYRDDPEPGIRVRRQRVNGIELLEDVVISHAPAALAKGLELVLVTDRDVPSCWQSDCGLLRQLLDNLVGNAVKFTSVGHVALRVAVSEGDELVLSVCDSGPGVGQKDLIFDAWQRGVVMGPEHPGSGLGLFICRRIVDHLGGSLTVNRESAGGSRFDARIPSVLEAHRCGAEGIQSLSNLVCRLELEQPLMESVQRFLDRLGVGWRCDSEQKAEIAECGEEVCIVAGVRDSAIASPGISLSISGAGARAVTLASPVLESSLEQALFQLLLQQRFRGITRNDKPG